MSSSAFISAGATKGPIAGLYEELRHALVTGNLTEAEMVGVSLEALLSERENFSTEPNAENQMHREVMTSLTSAISSILSRDNQGGLDKLSRLPDELLLNDSMLWVAAFWTAVALRNAGDIPRAREAIYKALELAKPLGPRDRSTSFSTAAEIEYQSGNLEQAHFYLEQAIYLSEAISDRRGQASARLAQARVSAAAGEVDDAAFTAHNALVLDPSWPDPIVFLSRQAMQEGKLKKAERIITFLKRLHPRPAEAAAELGLLSVIASKQIPLRVVREYLRLEEALPSDKVIIRLEELVKLSPDFPHLREKLAWKLLHLGRNAEADKHFRVLAEQELDMGMRSSVRLGLGTAASQSSINKKPGKRLREAVHAVPSSLQPGRDRTTRVVAALEDALPDQLPSMSPLDESSPEETFGVLPPLDDPLAPASSKFEPDLCVTPAAPSSINLRRQRVKTLPMSPVVPDSMLQKAIPSQLEPEESPTRPQPLEPLEPLEPPPPPRSTMEKLDGRKAVFKGGLQHLGVPELLQFFNSSRMTGTLMISTESGLGAVNFNKGFVAGAAAPSCSNLGALLVAEGVATQNQVDEVFKSQAADKEGRLLGGLIVERGLATAEAVIEVLEKQVFLAVGEMMEWHDGQFAFSPDSGEPASPSLEISLDPQMVLLEVMSGD